MKDKGHKQTKKNDTTKKLEGNRNKNTIELTIPESQNNFREQTKQNKSMCRKRTTNVICDWSLEREINAALIGK